MPTRPNIQLHIIRSTQNSITIFYLTHVWCHNLLTAHTGHGDFRSTNSSTLGEHLPLTSLSRIVSSDIHRVGSASKFAKICSVPNFGSDFVIFQKTPSQVNDPIIDTHKHHNLWSVLGSWFFHTAHSSSFGLSRFLILSNHRHSALAKLSSSAQPLNPPLPSYLAIEISLDYGTH